ncbi:4Fe-4S binding protein [Desulfosarcina sp.]|uniref:4Fe-4S dicluster domain-containing protein n=1 Tax=Desulfosarcina sp. TaxID=2027861 RepID=UPI0039707867
MTVLFDICGIPAFIEPWIDRFYSPREIELLKTLGVSAMTARDAGKKLGLETTDGFLDRAWRRGVLHRLDDGRIAPADFHTRFESWALFEGWQDLPEKIKGRLNRWELDHYVNRHRKTVESLMAGQPRPAAETCPEYLLLGEVARLFQHIESFYLWPCNCRAMVRGCAKSQLTCIRFSNDRGIGWEISRDRALSIVNESNRQGLMQSAELAVDGRGRLNGALCNCCNDCCFPHQLSRSLGAEKIWPLSRYLAELSPLPCNGCGRCVRRCPFGAISQAKRAKGSPPPIPAIDETVCRGCGVCATGCPQEAIGMQKIKASALETYYT